MDGIMLEIHENIDTEYTDYLNTDSQPTWFQANRSLEYVSKCKENGDLMKAFKEQAQRSRKWKNDPSNLTAFVSGRAQRLFLATLISDTLPLLDRFYTHDIGDDEFFDLKPNWTTTYVTFQGKPDMKLEFDFKSKKKIRSLLNDYRQTFLVKNLIWAPFDSPPIPSKCYLPFLGDKEKISRTDFSTVFKTATHRSYIDHEIGQFKIATNEHGHPYVALKSLDPRGKNQDDFDTFIKAEYEALDMLRQAKSPHLIRAIAFYRSKENQSINFVLPYAQHGNLRDFWKNLAPDIYDDSYMKWVFDQLEGLALAISEMHGDGSGNYCRHGDLKPENILCFESSNAIGPSKQTSCVLVIADVGISRTDNQQTEFRTRTKLAKADTVIYKAPETDLFPNNPTSRRADIWALGCLYLEFTIWLLYKNDGLKRFSNDVGKNRTFYTTSEGKAATLSPKGVARVHPTVEKWINTIKKDPRCAGTGKKQTAIGLLLALIEERMLCPKVTLTPIASVSEPHNLSEPDSANDSPAATNSGEGSVTLKVLIRSPTAQDTLLQGTIACRQNIRPETTLISKDERAYATEVCNTIRAIVRDANGKKISYINIDDSVRRTYLARNSRDGALQLDDKWSYVADQEAAQRLRAELSQLPPSQEPLELCDRCYNLPLWSRNCSFDDTVAELTRKADKCSLCWLISRPLVNRATLFNDRLHFFRVDSYLKFNNNQLPPILSLCTLPPAYDANGTLESHVQIGLPTLPASGSPLHMKLLQEWIRDCDKTHQCLSSPEEQSFLPTRLLDVGKRGSTRTRLVCDTTKLNARTDKYLALSHRWGPPKPHEFDPRWEKFVCTFAKSISTIARGVHDSDLPEKYQDAISVARGLEVQYLWIDSLCIIQEDKSDPFDEDKGQDFKKEVERMEMVFHSAYATLAAGCSGSSNEPFLGTRRTRSSVAMQAGKDLYYLCDAIDDFYGDVEQGALNRRGWVFQERALSRRTIHFTKAQTYWECGEGVRCETLTKAKSPTPSFLSDPDFPSSLLKYGAGKSFELYQDLYARYSRLALSHITDRPVAIRGLETRLLSVLRTAGGYGVFENDLCRGLLWQRDEDSISSIDFSSVRTAQARIPSWSWMSYAGPIRYMNVPSEWVSYNNEITSPWKANGDTRGDGGDSSISSSSSEAVAATELRCLVRDMHDIEPGVQIFLDDSGRTFGSPVKCVVLGSSKKTLPGSEKYYVLIVIPAGVGTEEEDVYARAGVASLKKHHIVWSSPPMNARIR